MYKELNIEFYGDQQYVAVADLEIAEYAHAKAEIEGEAKELLFQSILHNGVKSPIVINTHPSREGIIINGIEVYKIAKQLGIYEVPVFSLDVPEAKEKEYHYLFSIKCKEYTIEEIIEELQSRSFDDYFSQILPDVNLSDEAFEKGEAKLREYKDKLKKRKHTFPFRYDDEHKGYIEQLQEMLGTKSQNEALLKLLTDAVEGRIVIC